MIDTFIAKRFDTKAEPEPEPHSQDSTQNALHLAIKIIA